jgi:hypothetical protein
MVKHMGQKKCTPLSFCFWVSVSMPLVRGIKTPEKRVHWISTPPPELGELLAKSSQAMLSKKGKTIIASMIDQTIQCRISGHIFIISNIEMLSFSIPNPMNPIIGGR